MSKQIYKKDVFVSYSLNDRRWVDDVLLEHLGNAQISYFDQHRFEPGQIKIKAFEDAIEQSRCVLLVVTLNYLNDSWTDFANSMAFNFMLQNHATRIIPAIKEQVGDQLPTRIAALIPIELYTGDEDEWTRMTSALSRDRADACDECPQASPPAIIQGHATRDVLRLLFDLREKPEVNGPFNQFEAEFRNMRQQIKSLNQHKKLHDLFQQLEDEINVVGTFFHGSRPDDEVDWDRLETVDSLAKSGDVISDLIKQAESASFATSEDVWVQRLLRGLADFNVAVGGKDRARLRSALRRLQEVLNTIPARINTQLVNLAKSLRLTALEKALLTVHGNLKGLDGGGLLEKIKRSAEQIDALDRLLRTSLFIHDSLQQIEVELRGVEPFLEQDVERITDAWGFVWPKLQSICASDAFGWEAELLSLAAELKDSFNPEKQAGIKKAFNAVRRKVTRVFNRVDTDMLKRCGQLEEEIGEPLTPLLAVMQGFREQ
jgi:hypothetical protein